MSTPPTPAPDDPASEIQAAIRNGERALRDPADVDVLAKLAYGLGIAPLAHAQDTVAALIDIHMTVIAGRATNPAAFPGYSQDTTPDMVACRIIGSLLESGWKPPELLPREAAGEGGQAA